MAQIKNSTRTWLKAAGVRIVKTMAETAIALLGTNVVLITDVEWKAIASASLMAGIVCALTCIAGLPEVEEE